MPSTSPSELAQFALHQPSIQEIINTNAGRKSEIENAAYVLSSQSHITEENIVKSLKKSSDAIINGIKIFISYKHEDLEIANILKNTVNKLGIKRIDRILMSKDPNSIPPGEDWRERICSALQQSHWLYLLLPGPAKDRGWVLYEAGMFQASRLPGDKLIWFYHSDEPEASQIDDLQGVKLTSEGIYEFLHHEFFEPNAVPGMDAITTKEVYNDSELKELAENLRIVHPIEDPRRDYYVDYLDLEVINNEAFSVDDLMESKILHCSDARGIFGREYAATFRDLVSEINDESHGNVWINELADTIKSVLNGRVPAVMQAVFQSFTEGKSYRPLLYTTRVQNDRTIESFHIALTPALYTPMSRQPRELEALMTAFRLGYRFRWEVLEAYNGRLTVRDVDAVERIVQRIEEEARNRGAYDEEMLANAFDRPNDQQTIRDMFKQYSDLRTESADGKLDQAFKNKDPMKLGECLKELRKMNNEFMLLAAPQIADSVKNHWD
jgi:hypothetical protein